MKDLKNLIYKIENELNIKDIIGIYLDLEKKGNNYWAICPFHNDKNPSLSISPNKNIYKCFSCGAGGNSINFVQNYEGVSYIEALKKISEQNNIDWKYYISENDKKINYEEDIIKKINYEVNKLFRFHLNQELKKEDSFISKYFKLRNINNFDIGYFDIGYANENINIYKFLIKKGYKVDDILKTGLGNENKNYFNNRIIFAIKNLENEIVGFSGRTIKKDETIKYLNSKENIIFKKSNILYNLNNAKNNIKKNDEVIIVEGFFDVISLNKLNIENVVATMGTHFSDNHFFLINKFTKNLILLFDNDQAGRNASLKIYKNSLNKELNIWIYNFPSENDIDEFITKNNNVNLNISDKKQKFIIFLLNNLTKFYDKKYFDEKNKNELLNFVFNERNLFDQENAIKIFNKIFKTDYSLKKLIERKKWINQEKKIITKNIAKTDYLEKKIFEKEANLFYYLLKEISLFKFIVNEGFFFHNYNLRILFDKINLLLKSKYSLTEIINNNLTTDEKILIDEIKNKKNISHFIDLTNENEYHDFINNIIFPLRDNLKIELLKIKLSKLLDLLSSENNNENEILEILTRISDLKRG